MNKNDLSPSLQALLKAEQAPNSRRAMVSDLRLYVNWAIEQGIDPPIPAQPVSVAEWIAHLSSTRSTSSIVRYISSLSKVHDKLNAVNPNAVNPTKSEIVRSALHGLRRTTDNRPRKAPPLSGKQLLAILDFIPKLEWTCRRNRALLATGWAAALRASELHRLDISDLELVSDGIVLLIRRSKTDQSSTGHKIGIPSSPISDIISEWASALISLYGCKNGPLFPALSYSQRERWFPAVGLRKRLSLRSLHKIVSRILETNGISGGTCHSLRRGLITDAAAAGVPEHVIQRHSRHRSIAVLRGYVAEGNVMTDNPLPAVFSRLFDSSSSSSIPSSQEDR
jgi:integrase